MPLNNSRDKLWFKLLKSVLDIYSISITRSSNKKNQMLLKSSSCTRGSTTCQLLCDRGWWCKL